MNKIQRQGIGMGLLWFTFFLLCILISLWLFFFNYWELGLIFIFFIPLSMYLLLFWVDSGLDDETSSFDKFCEMIK